MKTKIFTLLALCLTLSMFTAKAVTADWTYNPVTNAPNNYFGASPSLCTWTLVTENGVTFGRFTHPATAAATDGPQWGAADKSFAIYNQIGPAGTSNKNVALGTNNTSYIQYVVVKMRKSTSTAPTLILSSLTQLNPVVSATPVVVGEWVSYLFNVSNTTGLNYKVITLAPENAAGVASITDVDPTIYFTTTLPTVLTVSSNNDAMGTVSGSGSYKSTVTAVLRATPKPGYRFVNWTEGALAAVTTAVYSTVATATARTIVANFAAGYTVDATSNDVTKGTVTGAGGYDGLSAIDVIAAPIAGNRFIGWVENGAIVSTNTTYNFTPAADRKLVATFATDATNYTSAAPASLTYIYGNSGNAGAKGSVAFDYLGTGDVTVSLPSTPSYEISLTNGSGYSDGPITLTAVSTNVPYTTIYVRLKDGLSAAGYPTNLTLTPTTGSPVIIALTGNVTKRPIFATGITVSNKIYDQTTAAVLSGGTLSDVLPADVSDVALTTAGTFSDYNAFPLKMVTATLSGAKSANYDLTFTSNATIYPKLLNVGITYTAGSKVYDRTSNLVPAFATSQFSSATTSATLLAAEAPGAGTATDGMPYTYTVGTGAGQLTYGGARAITAAGHNSATAAVAYCCWLTGPTLTGGLAANYVCGVAATITPKPLTVAGVNKVYDGTTTATTTLTGVVTSDVVTLGGTFADKNVGTGKTVTLASNISSAAGAGAGGTSPTGVFSYNYSVAATTTTANITAKALTIATPAALTKVYDGTNAATITGTLTGIVGSDDVSFIGTGTFADVNKATGIAVTAACTLTGAAAANYTLTQPTGLVADITDVTGLNKLVEDGLVLVANNSIQLQKAANSVQVYNALGAMVYSQNKVSIGTSISLKCGGIYLIKLTTESGIKVQKIILH